MKIAIVHDSLNPLGGAERVALYMGKALSEAGYLVDLVVLEPTSWEKIHRITGETFRKYFSNEKILMPRLSFPTIYGRYITWFIRDVVGLTATLRRHYHLIITTKQLHVPILSDVAYFHFPDFYPGVETLYYPDRYAERVFLRAYSLPTHILSKLLLEFSSKLQYRPLVLTNSTFSKVMIKKWTGLDAVVLHPPVEVSKYLAMSERDRRREDLVISIGRVTRYKNFEAVVEIASFISQLAARFVIIGMLENAEYYRYLLKLLKDRGLNKKVIVLANIDEDTKQRLIGKAKVYLHPMKYEHFGISVVEAMASGLVPVVHKYSGTWTDIVKAGEYGFGFTTEQEAAKVIAELLTDESKWRLWSNKAKARSMYFSYEVFKRMLLNIIYKLL